ncbi:MAG: alanine racemase [Chitinophagaceae bacterium]|nr:alanine racemase [Chitinophagaceae bacterium]
MNALSYTVSNIASVIEAEAFISTDNVISHLLFDSRKVFSPASSLFFALKSQRRNGHQFIAELYRKGVRSFVVSERQSSGQFPGANFLLVNDTLSALQQIAAYHRRQFHIPVIGITGSNGKTIVKEWLYQLLHPDYTIVRSPKSFNSQIGVPLSVWQMNASHTLGIFEAGISQPGEMERLEKIIQPTIGLLTNIGEAHAGGFPTQIEKETEKRKLFVNAALPETLDVVAVKKIAAGTEIAAIRKNETREISIAIPFADEASVQNAVTCWQLMLQLGYDNTVIAERMKDLLPVNMRLELMKGINHCSIINDSYSADLSSFEIALNFLAQHGGHENRTVILSDFLQTSVSDKKLYETIAESMVAQKVNRFIGIGGKIKAAFEIMGAATQYPFSISLFSSADVFLAQFKTSAFKEETILIKGARMFAFERIVQLLEQKVHQTVLEINLNAIVHNLKEYQQYLKPSTKVMAMVKAFAYGSGGAEIAGKLQYQKVDYLGVAYADEGVELRKAGISLPIMVMNPDESAFDAITDNNLEPELYSFELLQAFDSFIQSQGFTQYPVHLEIETGMNRLGFAVKDAEKLGEYLHNCNSLKVQSVFSHLAASEEDVQDLFTQRQFDLLNRAVDVLKQKLPYSFITHIANSAAAIRHPHLQLDMVRLGIGLYGVDSADSGKLNLQTVATLKSNVAQLKHLSKEDTVSYNRRGVVERDSVIATIRIGYADGYPRRLGSGAGKVWIREQLAPVIGTVCMDMFMVDVTDVPGVMEGDEVVIFGEPLPVNQVARWAHTIPYEIMTGISQRVKRVYFEE